MASENQLIFQSENPQKNVLPLRRIDRSLAVDPLNPGSSWSRYWVRSDTVTGSTQILTKLCLDKRMIPKCMFVSCAILDKDAY